MFTIAIGTDFPNNYQSHAMKSPFTPTFVLLVAVSFGGSPTRHSQACPGGSTAGQRTYRCPSTSPSVTSRTPAKKPTATAAAPRSVTAKKPNVAKKPVATKKPTVAKKPAVAKKQTPAKQTIAARQPTTPAEIAQDQPRTPDATRIAPKAGDAAPLTFDHRDPVKGRNFDAWTQTYFQWVLGATADRSPLTDPSGLFASDGQPDDVWILAGNLGGKTVRDLTVPAGKPIFSPVLWSLTSVPADAGQSAPVSSPLPEMDQVESMTVTLDAQSLGDLTESRVQSGIFRLHAAPEGQAVHPVFAGERLAVADGYWFMLRPLSPGQHVLRVQGNLKGQNGIRGFALDITSFQHIGILSLEFHVDKLSRPLL